MTDNGTIVPSVSYYDQEEAGYEDQSATAGKTTKVVEKAEAAVAQEAVPMDVVKAEAEDLESQDMEISNSP